MVRKECLETAIKYVCNDRNNSYGEPEDNFNEIAKLWSDYLDFDINGLDVGIMMALFKIARIKTSVYKEDNFIDCAGYIACACELGEN